MNNNVLLNTKEAAKELNVSYYRFRKIVADGLPFKEINGTKLFPLWGIQQWLKSTQSLTDYTCEEKYGTYTSATADYNLERLLAQRAAEKLKNMLCNKSTKLKGRPRLDITA